MKNLVIRLFEFLKKNAKPRTGIAIGSIAILLFLSAPLFLLVLSDEALIRTYTNAFSVLIYSVIVLGILTLHANNFYIFFDRLSIQIIAAGCILRSIDIIGSGSGIPSAIYLTFLGISLIIYTNIYRNSIKALRVKPFLESLIWSIIITIALSIISASMASGKFHEMPPNTFSYFFIRALEQISFVTAIEEALFRGIIVGVLILNGLNENKAFIIQSVLFWLIHYSQTNNHLLFFVFIPILTIATTLVAKKYKMIYTTILVHTFVNVFSTSLAIWLKMNIL